MPMQDLMKMFLTDDDTGTIWTASGPIKVRWRVWRARAQTSLVLVEPAGDALISPHAGRIATFLKHTVLKGAGFVYIEHEPQAAQPWNLVTFAQTRHFLVDPKRHRSCRAALEEAVGDDVDV